MLTYLQNHTTISQASSSHRCSSTNLTRSSCLTTHSTSKALYSRSAPIQRSRHRLSPSSRGGLTGALPELTQLYSLAAGSTVQPTPWLMSALGFPLTLLAVSTVAGVFALVDAFRKTAPPKVHMEQSEFNKAVVDECPTLTAPYRPFPFITNGHVETIFAAKFRRCPKIDYERDSVLMGDGGRVALDAESEGSLPKDAPVVILLPGLTGGSHDSYVCYAVENARKQGIRAVVFNGRGTADSPVTTPQYYSACNTHDLRARDHCYFALTVNPKTLTCATPGPRSLLAVTVETPKSLICFQGPGDHHFA
eukprot:gene12968-12789_t